MSTEDNKAVVSAAYSAFQRGDVESLLNLHTPDALWIDYSPESSDLRGDWQGRSGIEMYITNLGMTMNVTKFVVQELLAEGDTVVSIINFGFTATGSHKEEDARLVQVFKLANEKIVKMESFPSESEEAFPH